MPNDYGDVKFARGTHWFLETPGDDLTLGDKYSSCSKCDHEFQKGELKLTNINVGVARCRRHGVEVLMTIADSAKRTADFLLMSEGRDGQ